MAWSSVVPFLGLAVCIAGLEIAAVTKATEGELAGTAIEEKEAAFFSFGVSRSKYKVPMDNPGKCQVKNPQIQQYFRASNFETSKSDIP